MEPLATSLDDVCDFIKSCAGVDDDLGGKPINRPVPDAVRRLNSSFGRLWLPGSVPDDHPLRWLLEGQDTIVPPYSAAGRNHDFISLILENQDVWEIGFRPEGPEQLVIKGDWWSDETPTLENALCYVLLVNFAFDLSPDFHPVRVRALG